MDGPYCGSGKMLTINYKGDLYACTRFADFCLDGKERSIGNIYDGINLDKVRPFLTNSLRMQSSEQCLNCEVSGGCATCVGNNFNCSDCNTIFNRTTFHCELQKANVRACRYFWERYAEVTGEKSMREKEKERLFLDKDWRTKKAKYIYFITSDNAPAYCSYQSRPDSDVKMSGEILKKGLKFAIDHDYIPIFLGESNDIIDQFLSNHLGFQMNGAFAGGIPQRNMAVYEQADENNIIDNANTAILLIDRKTIPFLAEKAAELAEKHGRINITIRDGSTWKKEEIAEYRTQLTDLYHRLLKLYQNGRFVTVNVLNDIMQEKDIAGCGAGENAVALAPNGKFYLCPAFYYEDETNCICSLEEAEPERLFHQYRQPLCSLCDYYQCKRCKFQNIHSTGELLIASKSQCMISYTEADVAREFQQELLENGYTDIAGEKIKDITHPDPITKIRV